MLYSRDVVDAAATQSIKLEPKQAAASKASALSDGGMRAAGS
jgi:hypothetical protein